MSTSEILQPESRFRLTGEVAERKRTFLLMIGENRIGSTSKNDIVLKAPGVSRSHAVVTAEVSGATVTDLGSKNGTFVNGEEVLEAKLGPGDEIGIGSVKLRFVEAEDEEAAMAFVVSSRPPSLTEPPSEVETEVASLGEHQGLWLDLLDRFLAALGLGGESVLPAALGRVARALRVDAAALCEWPSPDRPVVLAAWGLEDGETPAHLVDLVGSVDPDVDSEPYQYGFVEQPVPFAWCLLRSADPLEIRGLLLWGRFGGMEVAGPFLRSLLTAAVLARSGQRPVRRSRPVPERGLVFPEGHVVGESSEVRAMYRELRTACRAAFPVLVLGETGVGKEHAAKILHLSSPRSEGPFVAINCAAIPSDLLEAELFGIEKGVATGVSERQGRFQTAHGGTLFLDEIGDMPLTLQAKILRVLEEAEVAPVGGRPTPVDVRIVAATNADLLRKVESDRFRRDLYYRLAGYVVRVPPLSERRDDIPVLVEHFLRRIAGESERHVRGITLGAMRALARHDWPGNIRELIHEVRRLVYSCQDGEAVDRPLLSDHILASAGDSTEMDPAESSLDLSEHTAALERRLIRQALERTGGNRSRAARLLGVSRQGLAMKLERLGLDVPT